MDDANAADAAALLARNRLARTKLGGLPAPLVPPDEAAGYRVQGLLHDALQRGGHGELAGHKIGCTTPVMQAYLRIEQPCAGQVFASRVFHEEAHLQMSDFVRPGVECEIAVMLARDLPETGVAYDRESVAVAVEGAMAAIEIVDDRYQDFRSLGAPTLIADDFFNAGSVLAEPRRDWRELDLATVTGRMTINGREVGHGSGAHIMGHPLHALAWLANLRARQGQPLRAGEFVSLGSIVETKWIMAGDRVVAELGALGRVTAVFS